MERSQYIMKFVLSFCFLAFFVQVTYAQSFVNDPLYEAYSRGKMDVWYELMYKYKTQVNQNDLDEQLDLINYYYGYTGWLIGAKAFDTAEVYIDKSEQIIEHFLEKSPKNATLLAYKGAYIAFTIGISNLKAIYLGSASIKYIDQALEIDPENIQANIEKANSMFYCPSAFGGDKHEAIEYYKRAANSFEKQGLTINNWLYLNTLTALGMAYEATDQIQEAKVCYEKIILIKPNFMWVGEELYPDMLKRYNL